MILYLINPDSSVDGKPLINVKAAKPDGGFRWSVEAVEMVETSHSPILPSELA